VYNGLCCIRFEPLATCWVSLVERSLRLQSVLGSNATQGSTCFQRKGYPWLAPCGTNKNLVKPVHPSKTGFSTHTHTRVSQYTIIMDYHWTHLHIHTHMITVVHMCTTMQTERGRFTSIYLFDSLQPFPSPTCTFSNMHLLQHQTCTYSDIISSWDTSENPIYTWYIADSHEPLWCV
jgi:hypothetical protein